MVYESIGWISQEVMYLSILDQIKMEKRLAAGAAGLQELDLLRQRHQEEIQQLMARLSTKTAMEVSQINILIFLGFHNL